MGSARVIFVGAVSVVLGLYSVGLQKSERAIERVGEVHAYQMQAEEIAKSGIVLAINQMGGSKPNALPSISPRAMFDGTVSYIVDDAGLASNEARIRATGIFKGHTVVREAVVRLTSTSTITKKKKWSNWETVRAVSIFGNSEFTNQYLQNYRPGELQ